MELGATLLLLVAALGAAAFLSWRMRRPATRHRVPLIAPELWLFLAVLVALLALAHALHLAGLRGADATWLR